MLCAAASELGEECKKRGGKQNRQGQANRVKDEMIKGEKNFSFLTCCARAHESVQRRLWSVCERVVVPVQGVLVAGALHVPLGFPEKGLSVHFDGRGDLIPTKYNKQKPTPKLKYIMCFTT